MLSQVRFTRKAPALVLGLVSSIGGLLATKRGAVSAGLFLILLGVAFVTYSFTLKDWCAGIQHGWSGGAWGNSGFGGNLGECIGSKTWFEF